MLTDFQQKLSGNMLLVVVLNRELILGVDLMQKMTEVVLWQISSQTEETMQQIKHYIQLKHNLTRQMITDFIIWQEMCRNGLTHHMIQRLMNIYQP